LRLQKHKPDWYNFWGQAPVYTGYFKDSEPKLPQPEKTVEVTEQNMEEARELLEAVNDLKPEEWHKFISEADGEKRLSLMEGALEKNPLNTDLRVELIRESRMPPVSINTNEPSEAT